MFDTNSEPRDTFPVNRELAGGGDYDISSVAYDGVLAEHADDGGEDIPDGLPVMTSGAGTMEASGVVAAESEPGHGGVALLERAEDVVEDVMNAMEYPEGSGTYYSEAYFEHAGRGAGANSEVTRQLARDAGGGDGPNDPPQPPRGYGGEAGDEEPDDSGGDDSNGSEPADEGFLLPMLTTIPDAPGTFRGFDAPDERPEPADRASRAEPEFVPEVELLRRVELMTRMGIISTYFEGVYAGVQVAVQRAEAEEAAAAQQAAIVAAEPTPIAMEAAAALETKKQAPELEGPEAAGAVATGEVVELIFDSRSGLLVDPRAEAARAEADVEIPAERRELADPRVEELTPEANWWSGPDDDVLDRVLGGLRGLRSGQEDPEIKMIAKNIVVEEPTEDEIAAAGGDIMAARAEKIARAQQTALEQQQDRPELEQ